VCIVSIIVSIIVIHRSLWFEHRGGLVVLGVEKGGFNRCFSIEKVGLICIICILVYKAS
jgi:hypothetical protein